MLQSQLVYPCELFMSPCGPYVTTLYKELSIINSIDASKCLYRNSTKRKQSERSISISLFWAFRAFALAADTW